MPSCRNQVQQPDHVTLTLVDRGWFDKEFRELRDHQYREFTAETGIRVNLLPGPESAVEQLKLWRGLLRGGSGSVNSYPDVFDIDVIWPGILANDLLDLKPYVAHDIPGYFPDLVSNLTVGGRVIALPNRLDVGMLYYRSDLLRRYGYQAPPATWNELEAMAAHIQRGERSKGNKNFWGYVWEGAVSEALTCNALEWQASEGGGKIIEADGAISVNNQRAFESWERAANWVGNISPTGVTTYQEQDAMNLWLSGSAAFMRNWTAAYVVSASEASPIHDNFAVTFLPGGHAGRAEVFGGDAYGVSRHSPHAKEAIELVRYLCGRHMQSLQLEVLSTPPTLKDLYQSPELLREKPQLENVRQAILGGMISRPSTQTGQRYVAVSEAFSQAVHSVLLKKETGAAAAANLERQLIRIVGDNRQRAHRPDSSAVLKGDGVIR